MCRISSTSESKRSIAPLNIAPGDLKTFYAAYRAFAVELREPRYSTRTKLRDGELVVFDNRRTLHGRTAYASAKHPRHLQGCYLTRDSVYSMTAVLRRQLEGSAAS